MRESAPADGCRQLVLILFSCAQWEKGAGPTLNSIPGAPDVDEESPFRGWRLFDRNFQANNLTRLWWFFCPPSSSWGRGEGEGAPARQQPRCRPPPSSFPSFVVRPAGDFLLKESMHHGRRRGRSIVFCSLRTIYAGTTDVMQPPGRGREGHPKQGKPCKAGDMAKRNRGKGKGVHSTCSKLHAFLWGRRDVWRGVGGGTSRTVATAALRGKRRVIHPSSSPCLFSFLGAEGGTIFAF